MAKAEFQGYSNRKGSELMQDRQYEIFSLTLRYWYVFLIGYIFFQCLRSTMYRRQNKDVRRQGGGNIAFMIVLLIFSALGLLSIRETTTIDLDVIVLAVLAAAIFLFQYFLLRLVFKGLDTFLMLIVDVLVVIGLIMLQRLSPLQAMSQVEWFGLGCIALVASIIVTTLIGDGRRLLYPLMTIGVGLLILPLAFGRVIGGAKNWVSIPFLGRKFGFQPSEFVKIILVFVFAIEFSLKRSFKERLPVFIFAVVSVLILVLSRDLGGALLYYGLFIFIYPIATSDVFLTAAAGGAGVGGAILSYYLFSHVKVRVAAWKNPWANFEDKGYQIAHALIAIGSGGLVGAGLGLGIPYIIPASRTDLIFAAICEEMGILVGLMVIGFYAMIAIRGANIAMNAGNPLDSLLAMGATISLSLQSFIIIGGVIKLIPLTGVTMPFVSYGGSSMVTSFAMIGIIEGVAIKTYRASLDDAGDGEGEDE